MSKVIVEVITPDPVPPKEVTIRMPYRTAEVLQKILNNVGGGSPDRRRLDRVADALYSSGVKPAKLNLDREYSGGIVILEGESDE